MKFRRSMTRVQKIMAAFMTVAFIALAAFLVPEIAGVIDPAAEDTYSEIIFDLPLVWVIVVSLLHALAGVAFVWSAGHFIEGYRRRREIERRKAQEQREVPDVVKRAFREMTTQEKIEFIRKIKRGGS